jgi:hypothetical protein
MNINKNIKFFIACFLTVFFIFHLVCTLLYTLPEKFVSKPLREFSFSYIYPLFNQGWALFAPAPTINKELWVCYQHKNGKWSKWQQPFSNNLQNHQKFRITGDSKIVLAQSSILYYLEKENWLKFGQTVELNGDTNSVYFSALKFAVLKHLAKEKKEFKDIKIRVIFSSYDDSGNTKTLFYSINKK